MKHLKIGDKAPSFSGKDQNYQTISLDNYKGKKVVLYFYPKDDTPGCTAQACNLRDNHDALIKAGFQVIGVSADSIKSHIKFSEKYNLPFPLLADESKEIIELYGVWGEKKFMGKIYDGIHRTTFLINEQGLIVGILDKPNTKNHTEEIFTFFKINP